MKVSTKRLPYYVFLYFLRDVRGKLQSTIGKCVCVTLFRQLLPHLGGGEVAQKGRVSVLVMTTFAPPGFFGSSQYNSTTYSYQGP